VDDEMSATAGAIRQILVDYESIDCVTDSTVVDLL
jgi:hypothetical protein